MPLTIPELEELRNSDNPYLYETMRKMLNFLNTIPIVRGNGNPNGALAARPGTIYVPTDPLMGEAQYVKVAGTDENGWAAPINGLSGLLRFAVTYATSTMSAVFVVGKTIDLIPPANTRQMSFAVTVTGAGAVRLRVRGTNIVSNELAVNGTLTLHSVPNTARQIDIEIKATAATFTADVVVYGSMLIAGDQVMGSREDSVQGQGTTGDPSPEITPEHPGGGDPTEFPL